MLHLYLQIRIFMLHFISTLWYNIGNLKITKDKEGEPYGETLYRKNFIAFNARNTGGFRSCFRAV